MSSKKKGEKLTTKFLSLLKINDDSLLYEKISS